MTVTSIKKILAVGAVLTMGIWSSTAGAYNITSPTLSSCTYNPLTRTTSCSIHASGLLKGLRNVSKTPTAYTVTLYNISGAIFCTNPADNSISGQGVPFQDIAVEPLQGTQRVLPETLTRNGRSLAEIVFEDPVLIAALADQGIVAVCPNENWLQRIIVTNVNAFGQIVTDDDAAQESCDLDSDFINVEGCTAQDNMLNACTLTGYVDQPKDALGIVVPYDCTELCHSTDPAACYLGYTPPQ